MMMLIKTTRNAMKPKATFFYRFNLIIMKYMILFCFQEKWESNLSSVSVIPKTPSVCLVRRITVYSI